jgi:hypothetical protein
MRLLLARTACLWLGLGLLAVGFGPLIVVQVTDPVAHAIGAQVAAVICFWPGLSLTAVGAGQVVRICHRAVRSRFVRPGRGHGVINVTAPVA